MQKLNHLLKNRNIPDFHSKEKYMINYIWAKFIIKNILLFIVDILLYFVQNEIGKVLQLANIPAISHI